MRSASAAGRQLQNRVYVGVDCFGRGCYGGGGFNCNKVGTLLNDQKMNHHQFTKPCILIGLACGDQYSVVSLKRKMHLKMQTQSKKTTTFA